MVLSGSRFGRLLVSNQSKKPNPKFYSYNWLCRCDCGNEAWVPQSHLISGKTKSCGCSRIKHGALIGETFRRSYNSWRAMHRRCSGHPDYKHLKVCKEWFSFPLFLKDMGNRPSGKTLDRIDNSRGYSKSNCRWSSPKEQVLNRSTTVWLELDGEKKCISDWARELNIDASTLGRSVRSGSYKENPKTKGMKKCRINCL